MSYSAASEQPDAEETTVRLCIPSYPTICPQSAGVQVYQGFAILRMIGPPDPMPHQGGQRSAVELWRCWVEILSNVVDRTSLAANTDGVCVNCQVPPRMISVAGVCTELYLALMDILDRFHHHLVATGKSPHTVPILCRHSVVSFAVCYRPISLIEIGPIRAK